jgi:hypothetical protein
MIFRKKVEDWMQRRHMAVAMATLLELEEMPFGRWTPQLRSLSSTRKTTLALPGGWSKGSSTRRKSGPIWSTGIEPPLTSNRIFTRAECPP